MAMTAGFKQQCPSCEAMVPIRDTNLIGRKIDCPKCKYRFLVEDPGEAAEPDEDEAPVSAKKGKAGPRRRDEDDEGDEAAKPKGGNNKMVLGIALGAVALVVLVVV